MEISKIRRDFFANLFLSLLAVVLLLLLPSQVTAQQYGDFLGSRFIMRICFIGLLLINVPCMAVNGIRLLRSKKQTDGKAEREKQGTAEKFKDALRGEWCVIAIFCLLFAAALAMKRIGFILGGLAVVNLELLLLKRSNWLSHIIVSVLVVIVYLMFRYLLHVMLPAVPM